MRGLLDELPMFGAKDGEARVAKSYTAHDLLVVALCCRLEARYGLKRQTVVGIAAQLADQLSGPRAVATSARILILYEPLRVEYLGQANDVVDGLIVGLAPVFAQVDDYLIPGQSSSALMQRQLDLGPVGLATTGSAQAAKGVRASQQKLHKKGGGR